MLLIVPLSGGSWRLNGVTGRKSAGCSREQRLVDLVWWFDDDGRLSGRGCSRRRLPLDGSRAVCASPDRNWLPSASVERGSGPTSLVSDGVAGVAYAGAARGQGRQGSRLLEEASSESLSSTRAFQSLRSSRRKS
ncbi:TGF-beta receptor type-2 [Striga asiatica]|uniref:TGF-beta receptor type-2 n=1 Tax=Striga asiatica TaxID=4170 RepID=A0A5A7P2V6_STRAF|nr:TGF-beta receptor type-2 [Striga asiatica]